MYVHFCIYQLYEEVVVDNERLRRQLQKTEEDLLEARITIEKQSTNVKYLNIYFFYHTAIVLSLMDNCICQTGKSTSLSETEKRERRAMERKLSEMEEELKVIIFISLVGVIKLYYI